MIIFLFIIVVGALFAVLVYLDKSSEKALENFRDKLEHGTKVRFYIGEETHRGEVLTRIDDNVAVSEMESVFNVKITNVYPE